MTHKVYAFIGKQPIGAVGYFANRQKAKACQLRVNRDGLKILGTIHPVTTKIVITQ